MNRHETDVNMHRGDPMRHFAASVFLLIAAFGYPLSVGAAPSSPLQLIQSGSDRALKIIKSSLFEGGPSLQQRRDEILTITEEYFDFEEMGKRALGRPWKDLAPEKRQEFLRLFKQLLFNIYVSRIEAKTTSTTTTLYDGERIEGRYALVKTRVVGRTQADIEIDYRLLLDGGQWKVYDVVVEGISLVGNYREQFSSILSNDSFEGLLKLLREKVAAQSSL
jgi:phospholipid transport system substrate-binding protein